MILQYFINKPLELRASFNFESNTRFSLSFENVKFPYAQCRKRRDLTL